MIKSAEYITFEEGFLKEATNHGCDTEFLRGYIKQADEIVDIWKEAFDELAEKSGDPLYRYKMAQELMYLSMIKPDLEKIANFDMSQIPSQYQNLLSQNQGGISNWQNQLQQYANNP